MIRQEKAKKVLQELADSHLWKSTLQSFEVKVPVAACGLLSPVLLGKIYVLGYLADFLSEWQLEQEIRIEKVFQDFLDIATEKPTPQSSEMIYARRYYCLKDNEFLNHLATLLEDALYLTKEWRKSARTYLENLEANAPLLVSRPAGAPFYLHPGKRQSDLCCSGGCILKRGQALPEEKSHWTVNLEIEVPSVISTKENCVKERPSFPLGKVFGVRERAVLEEGDCEGGLRTKGIYKRGTEERPLITYVTVVYNRRELLKRCMESIWAQSYHNIEYIIIDGGSTDGTLELIKENEDRIDYFVSQPDKGIYNAMNKGISLASGDFLCFMNSDDTCTVNAAQYIVDAYYKSHAEIICGWIKFRKVTGEIINHTHCGRFPIRNNILRYPMMYHQALYPSRKAFEFTGYIDERYIIPADNKWTTEAINTGLPISLIEEVVAVFSLGGNSDEQKEILLKETVKIQQDFFPQISIKHIELTYFIMKRSVISDRELIPLFRKLHCYFKDTDFKRLIYECALYMCTDGICRTKNPEKLSSKWVKRKIAKIDPQISLTSTQPLEELRKILIEYLEYHISLDAPVVSDKALLQVGRLKSFHNCCQRIIERRLCWERSPVGKKCFVWAKTVLRQTFYRLKGLSIIWAAQRVKKQYLEG